MATPPKSLKPDLGSLRITDSKRKESGSAKRWIWIGFLAVATALAAVMHRKRGIAVAGMHGKTTTSSMAAHVAEIQVARPAAPGPGSPSSRHGCHDCPRADASAGCADDTRLGVVAACARCAARR